MSAYFKLADPLLAKIIDDPSGGPGMTWRARRVPSVRAGALESSAVNNVALALAIMTQGEF